LYKEKCVEAERITADIEKAAQDEINEWAKLTDKFSGELKRYQMICFYCATVVDESTVNSTCQANNRTQLPKDFGYTCTEPDKSFHGIRRHHFAQPKPDLINYRKIDEPETRKYFENQTSKAQLRMFLDMLFQKIRKYCNEKKISPEKLFKDHDKNNTGLVTNVVFRYILQEHCSVDPVEIEKIQDFFVEPSKKDHINYIEFLKLYSDSNYMGHIDVLKDYNRDRDRDDPTYVTKSDPKAQMFDFGSAPKSRYDSLLPSGQQVRYQPSSNAFDSGKFDSYMPSFMNPNTQQQQQQGNRLENIYSSGRYDNLLPSKY